MRSSSFKAASMGTMYPASCKATRFLLSTPATWNKSYCKQQQKTSVMFNFCCSYIELILLLQSLIRSSSVANWPLHLSCLLEIIPWCFAYDRHNDARYLSLYWLQMMKLPSTHPEASEFLQSGGFSVQRSSNAFAKVAADMAIEQSINRSSKTTAVSLA
eukprot:scpid89334/ scgid25014/ 